MTWYDYDHDWLYSSSNLVYRITMNYMQVLHPLYCQRSHSERFESLVFSWTFAQCPALWKRRTAPCDWPVTACHHILATAAARERAVQFDEAFPRCSRRSSSESSWKDLERYSKIELLMGQRRWVAAKTCMGSTDGTWKMQSNMISCN